MVQFPFKRSYQARLTAICSSVLNTSCSESLFSPLIVTDFVWRCRLAARLITIRRKASGNAPDLDTRSTADPRIHVRKSAMASAHVTLDQLFCC